jgi:two-component system, LytTR family, response regulator
MNCVIVDDEPLATELMEDYIRQISFLKLAGKCKNAIETIQLLNKVKIDLMFLDIQMPGINGMQLLHGLDVKPLVVFTTAFKEYAVESYNLNAVDYLLKPIVFDRFLKAVNKAYSIFTRSEKSNAGATLNSTENKPDGDFIFVKSEYKTLKINLEDILYIEGLKDYVKIFTGNRPILSLLSLKSLEEKLPEKRFKRVHRSFIVAIDKIESIERGVIRIGETRIPVGDNYKDGLRSIIEGYNI